MTWVFALMCSATVSLVLVVLFLRSKPTWDPLEGAAAVGLFILAAGFPVIGLAGTLWGVFLPFEAVKNVEPADKATVLAAGISEAMNSLAFGLLLAVPTTVLGVLAVLSSSRRAPKKPATPARPA
jgi:hypothetical protein